MAENESAHGWKTYLAAVAAILTGVVGVVNGEFAVGLAGIIGGFALLGLRGAAAKIIEPLQTLVNEVKEEKSDRDI